MSKHHGMYNTPEYQTWKNMKVRCYNKKSKDYSRYGGRGIRICDCWLHSFKNFYADIGEKPFPKAQINRVDNDRNYEPNNCQWVTNAVNNQNRSNNKLTIQQVKEIREKYKIGDILQRELALIYNVGFMTINRIIKNKTWQV